MLESPIKLMRWNKQKWEYITLDELYKLPHDTQLVIKIVKDTTNVADDKYS